MPRLTPERLRDHLWARRADGSSPRIYAIIDGARGEIAYDKIMAADTEKVCLYRGELHPELAKAAPYLVALTPDLPLTSWLLHTWGDSWGIFLDCSADMQMVRRHFRTFLMVYDENRKPMYFRYYDPRVLRVFLPTCNADELKVLFGPVEQYMVESENGDHVIRFALADGVLIRTPAEPSAAMEPSS